MLLNQHKSNQQLFGSFALEACLCLFMIFMTLWSRDFWRGFSFQLKLKELFLFKYNLTAIFGEKLVIPELPKSDKLPSYDDMAKLLVEALPASDRPEAYTLLVTQLLPEKWARRPTFLERREQVERIYQRLADALQQAAPTQRLHLLRADLCQNQIFELMRTSYSLAIARYLKEYPEAANRLEKRHREWASQWEAMSISELEDKAVQLFSEVERWEKVAEAKYPDLWDEYKLRSFNVQLKLEAAYSGSFHVAMGDFAIFLRLVGA